jgi:hypothetical protein
MLDALPELVWDDRFNLGRYELFRRIAPALSTMFAIDTCLAVEDLDAVVHRVGEDRREARLVPADARRGHDLVVGHAIGGHLKGLDDARRDLRIRNPANPGEGRSVVAGAHDHGFSPVANRRPPARREPLARELLLRAKDIGGCRGGVELVDRHQDVRDEAAERSFGDRLLEAKEVDPALSQEGSIDQALLHVPAEAAQLPDKDPGEVRVSLPCPRCNGLESSAALEVGAADAKLLDNVASGSGARDCGS